MNKFFTSLQSFRNNWLSAVKALLLVAVLLVGSGSAHAQTVQTFNTAGSSTWTVPNGVSSALFEIWGGGGGGGGALGGTLGTAGGGGGGGGYSAVTISVTPGAVYS